MALTLRVEGCTGSNIDSTISECKELAERLKISWVVVNCNGVNVHVSAKTDVEKEMPKIRNAIAKIISL